LGHTTIEERAIKLSAVKGYAAFVAVAVVLGAFAGAFVWAFFFLMNLGISFLWERVPSWLEAAGMPAVFYPLAFCTAGGLAIGFFQKKAGPYPKDMNEVMGEVKSTGRCDYGHMGASFFGALLPLLFGGSIGPEAGLTGVIPTECGCGGYIEQFKKLGSWEENDAYVPQPGDYIFYDWQDGTDYAATDNKGAPDHVGVVEKVSGQTITVIEGNMSGAVGRRTLKVNGRYIRGYGVPKYGGRAEGGSAAPGAKALAAVDKLAKLGVVNSPDYWRQAVTGGKVKYLDILLVKAAEKITKAGPRSSTPETGVAALVSAGVIDTPDYWLANYSTFPSLDALLRALGGAV